MFIDSQAVSANPFAALTVRETRLAVENLREEAKLRS
jgi:hypothetical protein